MLASKINYYSTCFSFFTKLCVTEIAYDFIPIKANLKPEELSRRIHTHCFSVFQKDAIVNGQDKEPLPESIPLAAENFQERLYSLRKFVLELAHSYIEEYFVTQFQKSYPMYKTETGLTIHSSADMLAAYSNDSNGNKMREIVYYCMNGMWEGNGWASKMESRILHYLQLRYTNKYGSCDLRVKKPNGMYFIKDLWKHTMSLTKAISFLQPRSHPKCSLMDPSWPC
jgi:hypothetical protein